MENIKELVSSEIKRVGHFILEWVKKQITEYRNIYGIIGLIAVVLVGAKIFLFYRDRKSVV